MTSFFIFRLDLRLKDNIGLIECFKKSDKIYLAFIFDPIQIDESKNKYFSHNCVQFMIESLKELYKKSEKKSPQIKKYPKPFKKLVISQASDFFPDPQNVAVHYFLDVFIGVAAHQELFNELRVS